jgi:hypothetical protein
MAHGQKHKKLDPTKGQKLQDPTRASKPSTQTYRYPLEKGLAKLNPRVDVEGNEQPISEYGRRYSGPSSVSVTDSDRMSDMDFNPSDKDEALDSLRVNGHGDQSGENNMVADLQRKIDPTGYPVAGGGSMKRQQDPNFFTKKSKP